MNAVYRRSYVPKWAWITMVASFLMAISAIWWASSANDPALAKTDVSKRSVVIKNDNSPPPVYRVMEEPSPRAFAPQSSGLRMATVTMEPPTMPVRQKVAPKQKVVPRQSAARKPLNSVRDMFPMGNVVDNLPRVTHRFRTPAELFPSFSYAGKLWSFSGFVAYSGQVDLVTIGYSVGERAIFALANSAGPGEALFVQSSMNPDKFAIYR